MKYTKHTNNMICWWNLIKGVVFCTLLLIISCDNSSVVNETPKPDQEISQIDNEPIVKLKATEFYHGNILDNIRDNLAENHGSAIVKALNEQRNQQDFQIGSSILTQKLNSFVRRKADAPEIGSTHLRVTEPDGESEDFVLSLRRYYPNPAKVLRKGSTQLKASSAYLALSPDRFYLQDDENGNEQWPVTFPAVSLDDPTDKISLTFNKNGFVSSSLSGTSTGNSMASEEQPDIVFAEATPVVQPTYIEEPCPDCGGGGGGGGDTGTYCTEVSGRGESVTGSTEGTQTYFMLDGIELWATGDGDGAAELQMFIKNDDNYDGECFPKSYKYRFDDKYYYRYEENFIDGADGNNYFPVDVNHENIFYGFNYDYDGWSGPPERGFPLIDLTHNPGSWRIVLSEDDKDYSDFSRRRTSDPLAEDIWTYDVADGNWKYTKTGFSSDSHQYGSSDDPIKESGVRRITYDNVLNQLDGVISLHNSFTASKSYAGGRFAYELSMLEY